MHRKIIAQEIPMHVGGAAKAHQISSGHPVQASTTMSSKAAMHHCAVDVAAKMLLMSAIAHVIAAGDLGRP